VSALTRPERREPRCGRGDCRLAWRHLGRCAMTPLGRRLYECERRTIGAIESALFSDGPRLGFRVVRIVGLNGAVGQ
jgi:hypothetical protein